MLFIKAVRLLYFAWIFCYAFREKEEIFNTVFQRFHIAAAADVGDRIIQCLRYPRYGIAGTSEKGQAMIKEKAYHAYDRVCEGGV